MIFSCDGHVGGPPDMYLDYIEPRYRADLEALGAENDEWTSYCYRHADDRDGRYGVFEATRLLEELDADGVAGQLLLHGHGLATTPFFGTSNDPYPAELRAAGARAYHRWLADYAADGHGRLVPVADCGPCLDMADTVAELPRVAEAGFSGVFLPGSVHEPELPPHHDRYFDPFWAACEDLGLVLVLHAAFGAEQGTVLGMMRNKQRMKERLIVKDSEFTKLDLRSLTAGELLELGGGAPDDMMKGFGGSASHAARKAMSQMLLGGVFDRFARLRMMLVELRADWVPATLAHLDALAAGKRGLGMRPSEYFHRNCWVAPSSPRPSEVAMRREIGIDRFLFATDYPHPEGTWPDTSAWLGATFRGVPEDELRLMLGENALACLALDPAPFIEATRRIGPSPAEVTRHAVVDPGIIDGFNKRSGYASPPEQVDTAAIDSWLTPDLVA
jgi:predicted TIM-barrel fold metal-dependent hydrolase